MRVQVIVLAMIASLLSCPVLAEDIESWKGRSIDLSQYAPKVTGVKIYPLGFSQDGWFAYTNSIQCPGASCNSFFLRNIHCLEHECELSNAGPKDKCYCNTDEGSHVLMKYGILPFQKKPESGPFPFSWSKDEYDVETELKENVFFSELNQSTPTVSGTFFYLVSKNLGRKRVGYIVHDDHSGIVPEEVRIIGWVKSPYEDAIVIFASCGSHCVMPFGAQIKTGFSVTGLP